MENNEFEQRRRRVADGLAARKLDALLVSFSPNLRYLSGFTGSNGALLVLPDRSILFTDPRYEIQAAQESTCHIRIGKGPLTDEVLAGVRRLGVRRACELIRIQRYDVDGDRYEIDTFVLPAGMRT